MPRFAVWTVYAPIGSWGSPSRSSATTAMRPTDLVPTRSALVGMAGAALGLTRERLPMLASAVLLATQEEARPTPQPMADYHTLTPPRRPRGPGERWARFEEIREPLSGRPEGAMLSWREFWETGLWTVALLPVAEGCPPAEKLAQALNAPRFPLFVGRKTFSLGVPPDAQAIEAEDLPAAFSGYRRTWRGLQALEWLRQRVDGEANTVLRLDEGLRNLLPDGAVARSVRRWDMTVPHPDPAVSARRFGERVELEVVLSRAMPAPSDEGSPGHD